MCRFFGRTSRLDDGQAGHLFAFRAKAKRRHDHSSDVTPKTHVRPSSSACFLAGEAFRTKQLPHSHSPKRPTLGICPPKRPIFRTMNKNSLLITPHPSPSLVEPPATAPLLQPLNTAWLDDSDIPSFLATSAGSKRRHDFDSGASLPESKSSNSNKFFLATPLELARGEPGSAAANANFSVNVVTPPSSPRFRLRMRPSTVDEILAHPTTSTSSTPTPIATNSAPATNQPVTPERISFNMMADLSVVSMKLSDHAAQEEQKSAPPSAASVPNIGFPSKRRKMMRRNSSFNALCA